MTRQAYYQHYWHKEETSFEQELVIKEVLRIRKSHKKMGCRKLLVKLEEQLLAGDFRRQIAHRQVGNLVFRIIPRAFRVGISQIVHDVFAARTCRGRDHEGAVELDGFVRRLSKLEEDFMVELACWAGDFYAVRPLAALGIDRVNLLLPPERPHRRGLARLGFSPAGELTYDGCRFLHFVRDDRQRPTVRMPASP